MWSKLIKIVALCVSIKLVFFCVETITIIVAVSLLCSLQERKWFKRSTVFLSKAEKILVFDLRLCWLFWSRATFLSPELEFPANLLYVLYSVEVYPVHGRLPCNFNGIIQLQHISLLSAQLADGIMLLTVHSFTSIMISMN